MIFFNDISGNFRQAFLWINWKQFPCQVKWIIKSSWLVLSLWDELFLESFQELQVSMIFFSKSFLTNNGLHGSSIFSSSIVSIQLIRNWWMILSIFFNSFFHQSGQWWQNVDWWIDLLVMQLSINKDLSFSNVTSKIWNWMGDIVILEIKNKITGIERIGIWVIEPFLPWTLPALS